MRQARPQEGTPVIPGPPLSKIEHSTLPLSLRQRFGVGFLADALIVISGVELGPVTAPRCLLDRAIDVAQPFGGYAQGYDLTDSHHHIPADHLRAVRRKRLVKALGLQLGVDLIQGFRFIVLEEYREQKTSAWRERRIGHLRRLRLLRGKGRGAGRT